MFTTKTSVNQVQYEEFIFCFQKRTKLKVDLGYNMNNYYIFLSLVSLIREMSSSNVNPQFLVKEVFNIIALYCNNNNLKMINCVNGYDHSKMNMYELEDFVELIRKDITFEKEMSDEEKILFMTFLYSTVVHPDYPKEQIINILKK